MKTPSLQVDTLNIEYNKEQSSHTDHLSDTAEVVRKVSKKIGNLKASFSKCSFLMIYSKGQTKVKWDNPKTVMVITKPGDLSLISMTRDLALWFMTTSKACQGVKV